MICRPLSVRLSIIWIRSPEVRGGGTLLGEWEHSNTFYFQSIQKVQVFACLLMLGIC